MKRLMYVAVLCWTVAIPLVAGCNRDPGTVTPPTQEELKTDSATEAPPGGPPGV